MAGIKVSCPAGRWTILNSDGSTFGGIKLNFGNAVTVEQQNMPSGDPVDNAVTASFTVPMGDSGVYVLNSGESIYAYANVDSEFTITPKIM